MKKDSVYFRHILDAITAIEDYTKDLSKKEFFYKRNRLIRDGVVRQLEIIGEAVKNISSETKKKTSNIPWRDIAGMRDNLIHEYFGVELEDVWKTVEEDLKPLKSAIRKLL